MSRLKNAFLRLRFLVFLIVGGTGLALVLYLSGNVIRDLRLLSSARSDNVQWTLSQIEIEFIELELELAVLANAPAPDLTLLRREYDIFYSRIQTMAESLLSADLREEPAFAENLAASQAFLDETVDIIDASDAQLFARLPELAERARALRPSIRRLSTSGMKTFAREADVRRGDVAVTLRQTFIGVTVLLVALVMLALYLGYLIRQSNRRRAEAVEASRRMNIVTSASLDAVIVADRFGTILDYNAAAEQMFGYRAADAIGQDLGALIVPDRQRSAHDAGMERLRKSGEKLIVGKGRIKLEARRSTGEMFPVEVAIQSAQTHEGEIFIAFLRDISRRLKAEQDLVIARDRALAGEKAKTDFMATMSHEIRTPLNGLLGNLMLLSDTPLDPKQSHYIKNMDTSGRLLMSHISDVLDITKYDAGKLRLHPVAMNISTLLQDIIDNQSSAAAANKTTLEWHWISPPIEWIKADRDRFQHILMNVIGNAVKFTHTGHVTIQLEVLGDPQVAPELQILVADTGVGMDAALQAQIFDDFMTGDASYDRDVGGTGLGLGIAQRFAHALGGEIDVKSTKGVGSTFSIRLPVEPIAAPDIVTRAEAPAIAFRPQSILLVEDNEINRFVVHELLIAAGHRVTEAHNGSQAVSAAQAQRFDLILMDISMPVMDGRAATRAIRAGGGINQQTPIVAITANAMAEEQQAFLLDGMNDILTKPLVRGDLLRVIARYGRHGQGEPDTLARTAPGAQRHLSDLRETLGDDKLGQLLERFSAEIEASIAQLQDRSSLSHADIAELAHRMAGTSATLGATNLRAAMLDLGRAAKAQDDRQLGDCVAGLPAVWAATRQLLQDELGQSAQTAETLP